MPRQLHSHELRGAARYQLNRDEMIRDQLVRYEMIRDELLRNELIRYDMIRNKLNRDELTKTHTTIV